MIGFGDPIFNAEREGGAQSGQRRVAAETRGYADFWQGAGVDRALLGQVLVRLEARRVEGGGEEARRAVERTLPARGRE